MLSKQDLGVLWLYRLGYSRIRNLIHRLKREPLVRIVTFHDILQDAAECFENNLVFLKRKTNVVSLGDLLAGRLSRRRINVVITFDDGYKSWITVAMPILTKLKLPATFFISSGFVGLSQKDEEEFLRSKMFLRMGPRNVTGGLSVDDVREMARSGFALGGHTRNHVLLSELRDIARVRREISEDKAILEAMGGTKIEYFAYPSGEFGNPDIDLAGVLKESGYSGAVTTQPGFNTPASNPFLWRRELTRASMPGPVFRARVYGNYDLVHSLKKRALKMRRTE